MCVLFYFFVCPSEVEAWLTLQNVTPTLKRRIESLVSRKLRSFISALFQILLHYYPGYILASGIEALIWQLAVVWQNQYWREISETQVNVSYQPSLSGSLGWDESKFPDNKYVISTRQGFNDYSKLPSLSKTLVISSKTSERRFFTPSHSSTSPLIFRARLLCQQEAESPPKCQRVFMGGG